MDGCTKTLGNEKRFYQRARCCSEHAFVAAVPVGGLAKRFCQQCCAFHDTASFDGDKR